MQETENPYPFFPIADYRHHRAEIDMAVAAALERGHYILGSEVAAFEEEFARFTGTRHAIGVANGTDALELILRGLGIGREDLVAAPSHTAVATISAIERAGAEAVFVDIEPATCTICPDCLAGLLDGPLGHRVKAVIAVHLYGHPAAWDRLAALAEKHGIQLIEDCAQSHGATWQGRTTGSLGRAGAFSFYPTKNLGAIGDGGTITTDDDELAERIRALRQYGWAERYVSRARGVNSRLDELQAAILRVKLRTLPSALDARRAMARRYRDALVSVPDLELPAVMPGCGHAYHLHVIQFPRRDELHDFLSAAGIPVAIHYPMPVHRQPAYASADVRLPVTDTIAGRILSLPLHPYLDAGAIDRVCGKIHEFH